MSAMAMVISASVGFYAGLVLHVLVVISSAGLSIGLMKNQYLCKLKSFGYIHVLHGPDCRFSGNGITRLDLYWLAKAETKQGDLFYVPQFEDAFTVPDVGLRLVPASSPALKRQKF